MNKQNLSIFVLLLASVFSISAYAALCSTTTTDGQTAFLFKPNPKGLIIATKTLAGTVATLPKCAVTEVKVFKEIVETYVVPNPVNDCERQAVLACEPSFKGLPIGNVSGLNGYCGFVFLTTKTNGEDITIRYLNGQVYNGSKSTDLGRGVVCNNPAIK